LIFCGLAREPEKGYIVPISVDGPVPTGRIAGPEAAVPLIRIVVRLCATKDG